MVLVEKKSLFSNCCYFQSISLKFKAVWNAFRISFWLFL